MMSGGRVTSMSCSSCSSMGGGRSCSSGIWDREGIYGKQLLLRSGLGKVKNSKKRDIYGRLIYGSGWKFGKSLQNSPKLVLIELFSCFLQSP